MKNIKTIVLVVIVIFFASCSKDKNTYRLSGELKNGANGTLYLMEMQDSEVKVLDTIKLDAKGRFDVKEKLIEPSIFILQASNDYIMLCPQVDENIKIKGDFDNLAVTYSVIGSEECSKLKQLNDKQVMTRFALKNMSEQLQMTDIDNIDSVRAELSSRFRLLRDNQRQFVIGFINSNEGSLTTLVALYRNMENTPLIDFNTDLDIYKQVLKGLQKKYPNNKNTKNLEHFISRVEQFKSDNTNQNVTQ